MKKIIAVGLLYPAIIYFLLFFYFGYSVSEVVLLPQPKFVGKTSFERALSQIQHGQTISRSTFNMISREELSQVLWAAQGITDPVLMFRSSPSAGGLYPIEIFVVVTGQAVSGLSAGIYHYDTQRNSLTVISKENFLNELGLSELMVDQKGAFLVLNAVYERTARKYGSRAERYVHLEVGHIAENLQLQASSLNLTVYFTTEFNKSTFKAVTKTGEPLLAAALFKPSVTDGGDLPTYVKESHLSVEETIINRRSVRNYGEGIITKDQLLQLLWASKCVNVGAQLTGKNSSDLLTYVAVGEIEGLKPGVYRYDAENAELVMVSMVDIRENLYDAGFSTGGYTSVWVKEGRAVIVISAPEVDDSVSTFIGMVESGSSAQNIHLGVVAMGLGSVTVGAFNDEGVANAVGLPGGYIPFIVIPIGPRP